MPLFLITGLPGSGKSTVCAVLRSKGYKAYDADGDKLARWYDPNGVEIPDPKLSERTAEYIKTNSRDISRATIQRLVTEARNISIFLCGDPENEAELRDLFTKIFALDVDQDTLKRRLATRTDNDWGKAPHELQSVLTSYETASSIAKRYGYTVLDASQNPGQIVDEILSKAL